MLYPNLYPEKTRRIRAPKNKSSFSLNLSIINLEKEVSRLNLEIVELKLALAEIIEVLNNFSFLRGSVPPTESVEPTTEPQEPPVEKPTEPETPTEPPVEELPKEVLQDIDVTEEFYTAINGTLWLLN